MIEVLAFLFACGVVWGYWVVRKREAELEELVGELEEAYEELSLAYEVNGQLIGELVRREEIGDSPWRAEDWKDE